MAFKSTNDYIDIVNKLAAIDNVPRDVIGFLNSYITKIYRSDEESKYSKPMLWIGLYIALASLICIFAMVGDFLHGLRARKLWFPCKYFTINSASLTVIAVAMKLPVDLTSSMPGNVDQVAKLGSLAFMCSMMANLLPSLATMDGEELFTKIASLVVLVITLVVNICIQIATGVISYEENIKINKIVKRDLGPNSLGTYENFSKITATIYVTLLLMLLIIHICSSLAILSSNQIMEHKYRYHTIALNCQQSRGLTLEGLKQYVMKYWIMRESRSLQFIKVYPAATFASGVICVLSTILHIFTLLKTRSKLKSKYCESDYQWSMSVILVTQFIGVVVGTIASLSRCFSAVSFNMPGRDIWNHYNVFEIESSWILTLSYWKKSRIPIPFRSRKCRVVIWNLKFIILSFLIGVQKAVVVTCKMISLIPCFFMMCVLFMMYCLRCFKRKNTHQLKYHEDLQHYVLQLHEEQGLQEKTLKSLLKSVNRLFKKAEEQQPNKLMRLLEKSRGFEGVLKFDNDHVPTLSSTEYLDCWSLPVVTLTAIAVSLPNIQKDIADNFLESVSEALMYVTLMEESLNVTSDVNYIQLAAKMLWLEVEIQKKWLRHKLKDLASKKNKSQILQKFMETAKNMGGKEIGGQIDYSSRKSICANSMYRITKTIMDSYKGNIDQVSEKELFDQLSSMIADIVAACLTNLPLVIALKCQDNAHDAAQLLGKTSEIIHVLQDRELPSLNPDDLPFIHKWRAYLRHP